MADDGSTGGSLWTWAGTAANGRPVELIGIDVSTYDDDGTVASHHQWASDARVTHITVDWPYPAEEVRHAFAEGNL